MKTHCVSCEEEAKFLKSFEKKVTLSAATTMNEVCGTETWKLTEHHKYVLHFLSVANCYS
jgi:hypothetical protein